MSQISSKSPPRIPLGPDSGAVRTIIIEDEAYETRYTHNLLEACLSLGFDLPYFCWHPALGSVGACRQCAVKVFANEEDIKGKLLMACMVPVKEGIRLSIRDSEATEFRKSVIEWLMLNHPHDCPVCDEGGECHLQDMTVSTGHVYRRSQFKKRTFRNQNLGPFVTHEMNRCIACYRCVRYYRDYADGEDLNALSIGERVYFGRHSDGNLESPFSGNLVEVCPTGVFTDKPLNRRYVRPWDLKTAASVCGHCGLGCNTLPGERHGILRRIRNRYNEEINGYFLCDRGRYGYEYVNSDRRVRKIWVRLQKRAQAVEVTKAEALTFFVNDCMDLGPEGFGRWKGRTAGVGSPRATLEANMALRSWVGSERFYSGMTPLEQRGIEILTRIFKQRPAPIATLRDVETSDTVLILGEDVSNTAPRLALALKQSARSGQVWNLTSHKADLGEELFVAPDDLARIGYSVANRIDPSAPGVVGLSPSFEAWVSRIVQSLVSARKPVIVSGVSSGSPSILQPAANIAVALRKRGIDVRTCFVPLQANSLGLGLLGGRGIQELFNKVEHREIDQVILLENDLTRLADPASVAALLSKVERLIVIDHTATAMMLHADLILPASTFAESVGTYLNYEGRLQSIAPVFKSSRNIMEEPRSIDLGSQESHPQESLGQESWNQESLNQESWKWIRDLMNASGNSQAGEWSERPPDLGEVLDSALVFSHGEEGVQGRRPLDIARTSYSDSYFNQIPQPFVPVEGQWLAIPLYHVFGSEFLSSLSPGIAELAPRPYVALNPEDAAILEVGETEILQVKLGVSLGWLEQMKEMGPPFGLRVSGVRQQVPATDLRVKIDASLPRGVIGIPVGLPGLEFAEAILPSQCELANLRIKGVA